MSIVQDFFGSHVERTPERRDAECKGEVGVMRGQILWDAIVAAVAIAGWLAAFAIPMLWPLYAGR